MKRHCWKAIDQFPKSVERCTRCETERTRDNSTKSLFLYRGGRATVNGKPIGGIWCGFNWGVVPRCVEK